MIPPMKRMLVGRSRGGRGRDRRDAWQLRAAPGAKHGMVVSVQATASKIGADVLKDGGNAIDAAVAVSFALAVTHPTAGNIGGGGFFVYRPANGEPVTYDFREMAPREGQRDNVPAGREVQRGGASPQPHRGGRARNGRGHAHGLEGARQAPVEAARRTVDRAGPRRLPDDRELRAPRSRTCCPA